MSSHLSLDCNLEHGKVIAVSRRPPAPAARAQKLCTSFGDFLCSQYIMYVGWIQGAPEMLQHPQKCFDPPGFVFLPFCSLFTCGVFLFKVQVVSMEAGPLATT